MRSKRMSFEPDLNQRPMDACDVSLPLQSTALPTELSKATCPRAGTDVVSRSAGGAAVRLRGRVTVRRCAAPALGSYPVQSAAALDSIPWCSGYHVCFTRRRSPVRSRAESVLLSGSHSAADRGTLSLPASHRPAARLRGATVARLTPDQKVACSNHVGVMRSSFLAPAWGGRGAHWQWAWSAVVNMQPR